MGGAIIAIEALDALLLATTHASEAMQSIQSLLGQAHAENRDLTDDEVKQVIATRKAAEAKLQEIGAGLAQTPPPKSV
jgi:ADP-ribosylglycohydrolase